MPRKKIPEKLEELVNTSLGEDSSIVLNEIKDVLELEYALPPLVDNGRTYGDWGMFSIDQKNASDYRPQSALSIDIIEQMLKSAPVRFALEMKRAQIVSVFRNERSWKVTCNDTELQEIVTKNLQQILPKMALDFSFSSLAYGVSFQELVWIRQSKYELGLEDEPSNNAKFVVAKIPNSVNPGTIDRILRTKTGHFNGFVQKPRWLTGNSEIVVPSEASLIIPYEEKFRNLWGESILKPMYPIWYWYEIVLRAMVKYMERTGTPVAMVKAPARSTIIKPGTKERIDGISWGMEIASNVARSNAISIPSDRDEQGNPLWELSYLNSSERSQPFLDILELLTQMILRAGLSADRALSQSSGGVGSYSIGEVHKEATALHNELILTQWVHYLNTYFLPLYSLYNRGQNGPTVHLETQGLDPTDRTNLTTLLGVSQSMQSFQDIGFRIDWESLLTVNNIPLKSQEEADAAKKKLEEESLKKQEDMLGMQSKFAAPSPTKQSDGSLKANPANKAPEKKDSSTKKLENPNHDKLGRFASKGTTRVSAAAGFAGGGLHGAVVAAISNKLGVNSKLSGLIGGTIGGGPIGTLGSYVSHRMLEGGSGYLPSIASGMATTIITGVTVGTIALAALNYNKHGYYFSETKYSDEELMIAAIVYYYMNMGNKPEYVVIDTANTPIENKTNGFIVISKNEVSDIILEEESEQINLFNHFHSKLDGKFISGKSGSSTKSTGLSTVKGDIVDSKSVSAANSSPGKLIKTLSIAGGVGIAGITGIVLLKEKAKQHRIKELEEERQLYEDRLKKMEDSLVKFDSNEQAVEETINAAKELGFEMPYDKLNLILRDDLDEGVYGYYVPNKGELAINAEYGDDITAGYPDAVNTLIHEVLHSDQDVTEEEFMDSISEMMDGNIEYKNTDERSTVDLSEGQNQLAALVVQSKMYGKPINPEVESLNINALKTEIEWSNIKIKGEESNSAIQPNLSKQREIAPTFYRESTNNYAGLLLQYSKNTGKNPISALTELHKDGSLFKTNYEVIKNVFPEEMKQKEFSDGTKTYKTMPSQKEIDKWMKSHGYVNNELALQQILNEAVK
jgi:hypothetical protein